MKSIVKASYSNHLTISPLQKRFNTDLSRQRQKNRYSKPAANSSSSSVASARKGRDTCLRFEADNSVELDEDAWFAIPVPKGRIIYSRTVFQPFTFESADLLLALALTIWSSLFVIGRYLCHGRGIKRQKCATWPLACQEQQHLGFSVQLGFPPSSKQVSDTTALHPATPNSGLVPDQQVCGRFLF